MKYQIHEDEQLEMFYIECPYCKNNSYYNPETGCYECTECDFESPCQSDNPDLFQD